VLVGRLITGMSICRPLIGLLLVSCGDDATRPDATAPAAVTDLSATASSDSTVTLAWTAPGDDGKVGVASQYEARYSTDMLTSENFTAIGNEIADSVHPHPAGTRESVVVSGLQADTIHYFALRTADEAGNWSGVSNVSSTTTEDRTPPEMVTDFRAWVNSDSSVTLRWTAPGDDGRSGTAEAYDIRYSFDPAVFLIAGEWDLAFPLASVPQPLIGGQHQQMQLTPPNTQRGLYFALRAVDNASNWSATSNIASNVRPTIILTWGGLGTDPGQFSQPWGVAVDSEGNVYVCDSENNRVQKFDANGTFITLWGSRCTMATGDGCVDPDGDGPMQVGDGQFARPQTLAVDEDGSVYVADLGNWRIQKFDSNGLFVTKWGSEGTGEGQFASGGRGIAVDVEGFVYVTDSRNDRVQKFSGDGSFVAMWNSELRFPDAIATDGTSVYVTTSGSVHRFRTDGTAIMQWPLVSTPCGGDNAFDVKGIAVDSRGDVLVIGHPGMM